MHGNGEVSRRDALKGVAVTALGSLLAACGGASAPASQSTDAPANTSDATTAASVAPTVTVAAPSSPQTAVGPGLMRAPEPNPKRGGVVKWAGQISTPHFDLHQGASDFSMCHLYNNLVRKNLMDGLRTTAPDLAERWEVSPDGKLYTFSLRDGVKFHDGTPFSSADVVATFNRIIFPPPGMVSVLKNLFASVDRVEAVDNRTVTFALKQPQSWLLDVFTLPSVVIYSKKSLDENNNDLRKVIAPGTGAFMSKERREGEKWVLVKNPNYWDPMLPYVDGMDLLHLPEWTDRGTAVLTGQADLSLNTSVQLYEQGLKQKDIVSTRQLPSTGIYMIYYNTQHKPFTDPRVRRAINLAINHQAVIKAFENAEAARLTRWLPRASPYATPQEQIEKLPGYRPDKAPDIAEAKKLLANAGYPNGFKGVDLLSADVASHSQIIAPAIQEQLMSTLNIEAKIRVMERGLLPQDLQAGKFDMAVNATTMTTPIDGFPAWNIAFKSGAGQNFPKYANPQFDALLDQINQEQDTAKRQTLIAQAQDLLDQDPPWFVIGWTDHNPIWRNTTKGLALDKRLYSELGRIETVWLDK